MTETQSIPDRLAAAVRQADANMNQAITVARAWESYRDELARLAREHSEWIASRQIPRLPDLPGLPLPAQANGDPLAPLPPNVVDARLVQAWPHAPADPDGSGLHRTVPDGSGAPQKVPEASGE